MEKSSRYQAGIDWGGLCFSTYSIVTFVFSFVLVALSRKVSRKVIHTVCLVCGAVGLLSVGVIHDKNMLFISMTGVGIAWASILSMPYAMLSGALPANKIGIYMGIFNFFIVLPEIAASLGFGWIMEHVLNNNRLAAVVAGGVFMLLAAVMTLRVDDVSAQKIAS
jgi:maltose/moltooligosaccharide transporter